METIFREIMFGMVLLEIRCRAILRAWIWSGCECRESRNPGNLMIFKRKNLELLLLTPGTLRECLSCYSESVLEPVG